MSNFKITITVLLVFYLMGSCANVESPASSNVSAAKTTSAANLNSTTASAATPGETRQSDVGSSEGDPFQSPRQSRPRRRTIHYPEDCQSSVVEGAKNWRLQTACAAALDAVLPDLPTSSEGIIADSQAAKLDCDYSEQRDAQKRFSLADYGATFYPLSPNKYLVEIRCLAGAYNVVNTYVLYDESALPAHAQVVEFPSLKFVVEGETETVKRFEKTTVKTVGAVQFNPLTKRLIVFVKARGIGDAGHYARYRFVNDRPQLEEFRAKFDWNGRGYGTDEILKRPPKTWKRYYPNF